MSCVRVRNVGGVFRTSRKAHPVGSSSQWGGAVHGSRAALVGTLRQTLLQLENSVPAALLHPNWAIHRSNWLRAVNMCTSPRDFSLALAILEASVKPVLFNAAWSDVLGEKDAGSPPRLLYPPVCSVHP